MSLFRHVLNFNFYLINYQHFKQKSCCISTFDERFFLTLQNLLLILLHNHLKQTT